MNYKPQQVALKEGDVLVWDFDKKVSIQADESGTYFICTCGQTLTAPFCDGAHMKYNADLAESSDPLPW